MDSVQRANQRQDQKSPPSQKKSDKATANREQHVLSTLCAGSAVHIFCRHADAWVEGEVTDVFEEQRVRVEYKVGDDWCCKQLNVNSEHLLVKHDTGFPRLFGVCREERVTTMAGALPTTMKIAIGLVKGDYTKEGMIEWQDQKVPEVKADFVLIQVKAVAMNRVDVLRSQGASGQKFPIKPLTDVSGVIVAVGPKAKTLKTGDEVVTCTYPKDDGGGCLAEYVIAREGWVGPKPAGWTHAQGSVLGMTTVTAGTTIKKAGPLTTSTDIVLVGASGGVGAMVLALSRPIGSPILAVASSSKHEFVRSVGGPTVQVLDYKKEDWTQRYKDKKPHAVIDVSSVSPVDAYYKACSVGAKMFITTNTVDPSFMMTCNCLCTECCFQCKAKICSCCCSRPTYTLALLSKKNAMDMFQTCSELAANGTLQPPPLELFAPKQVHMAYKVMKDASAKAVIDMSNGI